MGIKKLFTILVAFTVIGYHSSMANSRVIRPTIPLETRQIALILKLKRAENIYLESNRSLILLPAKSVIAFKIPREILEEHLSLKKINLIDVISTYEKSLPQSGQFLHKITILESTKSKKKLIGIDAHMNILRASVQSKLKLIDFEEPSEDTEEDLAETKEESYNFCSSCTPPPVQFAPQESRYTNVSRFLFPNSIYAYVKNYSTSHQAQILINNAIQKISYKNENKKWRLQRKSQGWCAMNVRLAIEKTLTFFNKKSEPVYLNRKKRAKNLGLELVNHGYVNLLNTAYAREIENPYDAPVGSILVYDGGKSGHSEIRLADGFVSDYFSPRARTGAPEEGRNGRKRRLIGVYIKI